MAKQFYTERDIEDLVKRGVMTLEVSDDVVLTEVAYEKAHTLGMKLLRGTPDNPPSAPVRPYLAQKQAVTEAAPVLKARVAETRPSRTAPAVAGAADLSQRIRDAVVTRLGTQVDPNLLSVIIRRVLAGTGAK